MGKFQPSAANEALAILQDAGFVPDGDRAAMDACMPVLETLVLTSGQTLIRQGEAGDALYVVISGRLRAYSERDGDLLPVGEIGRGEIVGEMALLSDAPRAATVKAVRDSRVVRVPRRAFEQMAAASPAAVMHMTRTLVARLQRVLESGRGASPGVNTVAVAPVHAGAPAAEVAERLCRLMGNEGGTLWLDAGQFDDLYGQAGAAQIAPDDPKHADIVDWLAAQETAHRFVVYEADTAWSQWTQRCFREADRILLVADATANPSLGEIETAYLAAGGQNRCELVLVQPDGVRYPHGTQHWLEPRRAAAHHHIRLADDATLRRLYRRLTGKAVGLVFSGGAARGFAHIGVVRALEEAGVEVDLIGGTSMGALMAAAYAMDWDYAEMDRQCQVLGSTNRIFDRTLPMTAMMESAKVTRIMQSLFGEMRIEDLWRPFFCVSTDLSKAEPILHRSGLLWEAVRCSLAIPGIFTPILFGGDLVVDGGVMNNMPVDVMRQTMEAGKVIAVNASPRKSRGHTYQFGPSISGWKVLASRINPFSRRMRVPSITGLLLRSLEVNSTYQVEHQLGKMADVYVEPALAGFNGLDWDAHPDIIEAGYAAAKAELAGWTG